MEESTNSANVVRSPNFRMACQTITWDPERIEKRDYTVEAVARAGYEGLEIGARFLDLDHPREFKHVLDENGVQLIAMHAGWRALAAGGSGEGRSELGRVIDFAQVTGTPLLVVSGGGGMLAEAEKLNPIGQRCRGNGMTLCYHNHGSEIQDNARILREIVHRTDPELVKFCPDIGWVRKVTPDFIDVLEIIRTRIRMVHFKDHVADDPEATNNETEFGRGIMDFRAAFAFLRRLPVDELWVVAEQSKSTEQHLPPEESIKHNLDFLRAVIAESR